MSGLGDIAVAAEAFFDSFPHPMILFDIDTFAIEAVNEAAIERYGYSREEFLERSIMDIRPAEDVPRVTVLAQRMMSGIDEAGTSRHRTKSGEIFIAEVHTRILRMAGRRLKLASIRDVTHLVEMEEEGHRRLAEAERIRSRAAATAEHFRSLFNLVPGKFLVLEPEDYRIVAVSDGYLAATMTVRERLVGRRLFDAFPDDPDEPDADGAGKLRASLERVEALGQTDVMAVQRYPIRRPEALGGGFEERYWSPINTPIFGADGKLACIVHRVEDVTALMRSGELGDDASGLSTAVERQAETLRLDVLLRGRELEAATASLAEQAVILRAAERLLGIAYWSFDPDSGRLEWSDSVFAIYGLPPGSEINLDAYVAMVHEDDRSTMQENLEHFLASGETTFTFEHRTRRPDGGIRYVRGAAEYAAEGRRLTGLVQDITEIRTSEIRARQNDELLKLASRMARFGGWRVDLASKLAHWTEGTAAIHGTPGTTSVDLQVALDFYPPDYRERIAATFFACAEHGTPFDEVLQILTANGQRVGVQAIGEAERDRDGRIIAVRGAFQDISEIVALRDQSHGLAVRLQNALETMSDGFFTLDEDWRFTFVNRQAERTLQRCRDELLGRVVWDEFPEAVGSRFEQEYCQAIATGDTAVFREFYPPLDLWVEVRAFPSADGLAVYFRDVTAEHQRAEQLRLLEAAVAQQQDVLVITEASGIDAPNGPKVVYVNPAFERVTGFRADEIAGLTWQRQHGPQTQPRELERIKEALATGQPVRADLATYRKDDSPCWQEIDIAPVKDDSGEITNWVAVHRDISERKTAEAALRASEERFRPVTLASNDVIWDWDIETGQLWWNDNFATVFGFSSSGVENTLDGSFERIHPDDRERVRQSIEAVIASSATRWQADYRFERVDGRDVYVSDRGVVMRDSEGRAVRMLGSIVDLTEKREAEARERRMQKMEAIGQLTGGIAHDFNNLLTVILGNGELLADDLDSRPQSRAMAEMTVKAAERGAELTSRLLAFARRQPLDPVVCDLNNVVASIDGLLRRTLGESIEIELVRGGGLWSTELDPGQLEVALLNLAINARDAMPGGGRLTIETGNAHLDQNYADQHLEVQPGQYVLVAVADNGVGMPPEVIERAFEPFFTTKAEGKGNGLGLSMVYGFVKQSGGHIKIYAEPGLGTTVKLYFPRSRATPADTLDLPKSEVVPEGDNEHILVVEDDPLVREHVVALIRGLGYRVTAAGNGQEALAVLDSGVHIDLLFTDIVMPGGMNGDQLALEATRKRPGLEVLFTSGYTENAIVHQGRLDPGVQLLSKPYRRQDLAKKLHAMIGSAPPG